MNENNLVPLQSLSEKQRKEIARKGGKASGKARREKQNFQKAAQAILESDFYNKEQGRVLTGYEAIALKMFVKALEGNSKAAEFLRDTAGESPKNYPAQLGNAPVIIDNIGNEPTKRFEFTVVQPKSVTQEAVKKWIEQFNRDDKKPLTQAQEFKQLKELRAELLKADEADKNKQDD